MRGRAQPTSQLGAWGNEAVGRCGSGPLLVGACLAPFGVRVCSLWNVGVRLCRIGGGAVCRSGARGQAVAGFVAAHRLRPTACTSFHKGRKHHCTAGRRPSTGFACELVLPFRVMCCTWRGGLHWHKSRTVTTGGPRCAWAGALMSDWRWRLVLQGLACHSSHTVCCHMVSGRSS